MRHTNPAPSGGRRPRIPFTRRVPSAAAGPAALAVVLAVLLLAASTPVAPRPAEATFHFAEISEVMTSYGGDTTVQFVEIKMLATGQNLTADTVLGAFDASGAYLGDVLVVPGDVTSGVHPWLMATSQFQADHFAPDFIIPASLPTSGGMICWGAPGSIAPAPGSWDHSVPNNYTDCVAYGTYSGPGNFHIGSAGQFPAPDDGDGHSLQRISHVNQSALDFACADPATPQRDNSTNASLPATSTCGPDADNDGVADDTDNCPRWHNPTQDLPPWSVPADDPDCDGFSTTGEGNVGTDPFDQCPDDGSDDAWPPDFNRSTTVNIVDVLFFSGRIGAQDGVDPEYGARFDFDGNGKINIVDVLFMSPYVQESCTNP